LVGSTSSAILTRCRVTLGAGIAILPGEACRADAGVTQFSVDAHASIVARRDFAEIDFELAMSAHVARLAMATVVVDELHAVEGSSSRARIG
jgi:hypothetical protein